MRSGAKTCFLTKRKGEVPLVVRYARIADESDDAGPLLHKRAGLEAAVAKDGRGQPSASCSTTIRKLRRHQQMLARSLCSRESETFVLDFALWKTYGLST